MEPRIDSLHVHPVKSCRALSVDAVAVTARGFDGDREFAFLDDAGRVLTQRRHPRLATVDVAWDGTTLTFGTRDRASVVVDARDFSAEPMQAVVHGSAIDALRHRDAAASVWMTELLETPATLVRCTSRATRSTDDGARWTTLTDAEPISVLSRASVDALNARLDAPVPIDRFRANVILDGVDAFFEDRVESLTLGTLTLASQRSIERCVMIQTDQRTGERGVEPMRTLHATRSVLGRVFFGRYFRVRRAPGEPAIELRVGDPVVTP